MRHFYHKPPKKKIRDRDNVLYDSIPDYSYTRSRKDDMYVEFDPLTRDYFVKRDIYTGSDSEEYTEICFQSSSNEECIEYIKEKSSSEGDYSY